MYIARRNPIVMTLLLLTAGGDTAVKTRKHGGPSRRL